MAGAAGSSGGVEKFEKMEGGPTSTAVPTTGAGSGGGTGELLVEATQLLRSLRTVSAKAMVMIKQMNTRVIDKGLLDGATHALRR